MPGKKVEVPLDWDSMSFQIKSLFTPAAPIGRAELFAGRKDQLHRLFDAIAETGRHAVLFGERGVGKTSLANVFHELISDGKSTFLMPIKKQSSPVDTYSSLWRKVFREIMIETRRKGDYGNEDIERSSIAELYPDEIIPDDVVRELGRFTGTSHPIIVFDEFVKGVFVEAFLFHHPEQKRADWIISHDRVEQLFDLIVVPDKLSLDCRKVKFAVVDLGHRFPDSEMLVFHDSVSCEYSG